MKTEVMLHALRDRYRREEEKLDRRIKLFFFVAFIPIVSMDIFVFIRQVVTLSEPSLWPIIPTLALLPILWALSNCGIDFGTPRREIRKILAKESGLDMPKEDVGDFIDIASKA